jgi:peptidoglycan/xylan/chitin deacetylase (PgdA/CDA1 family)
VKQLLFSMLEAGGVNALFRRLHRGKIKVLLYHNVIEGPSGFSNAMTPQEFETQLRYLNRHYNIIGIDQGGQWRGYRSDKVNVLISFDDGFINNLEVALPILRRHAVPAVFFLVADCVATGAPPRFADRYLKSGGDPASLVTIDKEGAAALIEAGMTVGSHSLRHDDFSKMSDDEALADATSARARLEELCRVPVGNFAFPWGLHRREQKGVLADTYRRIFLTEHGFCSPEDQFIPRNEVSNTAHMRAAASGALDFLKRR